MRCTLVARRVLVLSQSMDSSPKWFCHHFPDPQHLKCSVYDFSKANHAALFLICKYKNKERHLTGLAILVSSYFSKCDCINGGVRRLKYTTRQNCPPELSLVVFPCVYFIHVSVICSKARTMRPGLKNKIRRNAKSSSLALFLTLCHVLT